MVTFFEFLNSPYRFLGLIWILIFSLLLLIVRTKLNERTNREWSPVVFNTTSGRPRGLLGHKKLITLYKKSEGADPSTFVIFLRNEFIDILAKAYSVLPEDIIALSKDPERMYQLIDRDDELFRFFDNPVEWLEQFKYKRRVYIFFQEEYFTKNLITGLSNLTWNFSMRVVNRSSKTL